MQGMETRHVRHHVFTLILCCLLPVLFLPLPHHSSCHGGSFKLRHAPGNLTEFQKRPVLTSNTEHWLVNITANYGRFRGKIWGCPITDNCIWTFQIGFQKTQPSMTALLVTGAEKYHVTQLHGTMLREHYCLGDSAQISGCWRSRSFI